MGELIAVLNGVEFRTRHNDYKMRMPHRTSKEYGATEDIPYPEVPPQVINVIIIIIKLSLSSSYLIITENKSISNRW